MFVYEAKHFRKSDASSLSLQRRLRRIVISGEASGCDFINNESGAMKEQRKGGGGLYGDDLRVVGNARFNTQNNSSAV